MNDTSSYTIEWIDAVSRVRQPEWDALALPLKTPFLEWGWMNHLESSGSITVKTGWRPCHLCVWSNRRLVGVAPLYVKADSVGEFVFDYAWADLASRMGIDFYPKLVGMSPATPVPGYRFLVARNEDERRITELMVREIDRFCLDNRLGGLSFLYVDPEWRLMMSDFGFRSWLHQSFRWQNPGYASFEDYLSIFNSNQRHNIKRERKRIRKLDVTVKALTGDEIPQVLVPVMYGFYKRTNDKFGPWGCRYLNGDFFEGIYDNYRHRLLIMAAFQGSDQRTPVGMSFFLHKDGRLYGRYWGSIKDIHSLHFNACYYAPIEWAIEHCLSSFDPGIGSAHKIRRGFRAVPNYSLHRFYDARLQQLLDLYIDEINRGAQDHIDTLNLQLPFARKSELKFEVTKVN